MSKKNTFKVPEKDPGLFTEESALKDGEAVASIPEPKKAEVVAVDEPKDLKPKNSNSEQKSESPHIVDLVVDKNGNYEINTNSALAIAAQKCIATGLAPKTLADAGIGAVGAALLMCKQFALPQKAMSSMAYIHGRLTVYGSLYTALASRHPKYNIDNIRTVFVDDNSEEICLKNKNLKADVYACVIQIYKNVQSHYSQAPAFEFNEYYFTIDDAKAAGLFKEKPSEKEKYKPWQKYTKDMLYHKCKARAFSREFASALEGVELYEDINEAISEPRNVGPSDRNTAAMESISKALGENYEGAFAADTGEVS